MAARGGTRPGAGRKTGFRTKATLAKEEIRAHIQRRVAADLDALLNAQIANAKGLKYLVVRDRKSGKFIRVTEAMARHKQTLAINEEIIEVWEKDPSVQAFTDLLNRAADKPTEHHEVTGDLTLSLESRKARLNAAKQRVRELGP